MPQPRGYETFGDRIKAIRHDNDWSREHMAKLTGIPASSLRYWERGGSPQGFEAVCRQIATGTGYDLQWIMTGVPSGEAADTM